MVSVTVPNGCIRGFYRRELSTSSVWPSFTLSLATMNRTPFLQRLLFLCDFPTLADRQIHTRTALIQMSLVNRDPPFNPEDARSNRPWLSTVLQYRELGRLSIGNAPWEGQNRP